MIEVERPDRRLRRLANGHGPTLAYVKKRTGGTKADLDTRRRLKRYIAREVYPLLRDALSDQRHAVSEAP